MAQKFSKEDLIYMIKLLQEKGLNLNEWEKTFVVSVGEYILKYVMLTGKQIEVLDKIYSEKTI